MKTSNMTIVRALRLLLLLAALLVSCHSHESCCKYKLNEAVGSTPEFIVDPNDNEPPAVDSQGNPRWIPDPDDTKPDYWDDEDDGDWEPRDLLNDQYHWTPRLIRNPQYVPPPTYWDKLSVEGLAALPWVTLGIILTGLLNALLLIMPPTSKWLIVLKGPNALATPSFSSLALAAILGLATPLCSCGALPLAASFVTSGIPMTSTMAFLTASQSAGLDSAAITWGLLGPTAVLWRLGGAVVLAVAAGAACGRSNTLPKETAARSSCCNPKETDPPCCAPKKVDALDDNHKLQLSLPRLWITLSDAAIDILPTVLAGLAISTAALHYFPSLSSYSGDSFLVRLVLLMMAMPMQLCEHSTVTLAAAIQKAGGSPGLSFAFLMAAPATNMPTLLLLLQYGGTVWTVARVVVAIGGTALTMSYVVDTMGLDLLVDKDTNNQMADLPFWYVEAVPYLVAGMVCTGAIRQLVGSVSPKNESDGGCCAPPKTKSD